jgi:hypothetical protein
MFPMGFTIRQPQSRVKAMSQCNQSEQHFSDNRAEYPIARWPSNNLDKLLYLAKDGFEQEGWRFQSKALPDFGRVVRDSDDEDYDMDQRLRPNQEGSSSYCYDPIDASMASLDVMIKELRSQNERLQEIIVELLIKNQWLRFGNEDRRP